jgi:group I intron endonuclease
MEKIHYLYKITNVKNNKVYIGQTVQPEKRWYQHKNDSTRYKLSMTISRAIKKYGNESFIFEIIACCKSLEDANDTETLLVQQYESHVSTGKGYNISYGGSNGQRMPLSKEHKQKLSEIKRGQKLSEQHSENISKALKGKPAHNKGKQVSETVRQKISDSMKGIVFSEEHKQNLSIANTGKKHSEETKQKMKKPKSEETKKKMSEARKRYWATRI